MPPVMSLAVLSMRCLALAAFAQAAVSLPLVQADASRYSTSGPSKSISVREGAPNGRIGEMAKLEISAARGVLDAGGRDRTLVMIRAFDATGATVKTGSVTVQTTNGAWLPTRSHDADSDSAGSHPRSYDPAEYCRENASGDVVRARTLTIKNGTAVACLQSDGMPSTAELTVATPDPAGPMARTSVRFR